MNSSTMELVKTLHSPFKFLDAYQKEDIRYFFGRDVDVDQLYQLVCGASCLLVYGYSGVGKTSLIRCGLVNRFRLSNWLDIYIRRGNNINNSLQQAISDILIDKINLTQQPTTEYTLELLRQLYLDYFKPIYLVFDQFEELFLLGDQKEQELFTETIKAIVANRELKCKVILVMREEYIARLDDMEEQMPFLRQMRVRVKPLTDDVIKNEVIPRTCRHYQIELVSELDSNVEIASEPAPVHPVAEAIVRHVKGKGVDVSLPYLQLYLDRLWMEAPQIVVNDNQTSCQFTEELVSQIGDISQVLGVFLDAQLTKGANQLQHNYPDVTPADLRKVVNEFVTHKGTKKQQEGIKIRIEGIDPALVQDSTLWLLDARILRQVQNQEEYSERTIYELAHDALAKHLFEHRTDDDRRYYKLRNEIDKVYKLYSQDDIGSTRFLTKDDLARIQEFRGRLQAELPEAVWKYVQTSEEAAETERQRQLKADLQAEQEERKKEAATARNERKLKERGFWFAGIAFVALCLAGLLYYQSQNREKSLRKEESSRLVQLLDDYETKLMSTVPVNTQSELYDNPTLIQQIATEAANKVDNNKDDRANEWIKRLDSSKNNNVFYQLSIDSHVVNPVAGFTEDGRVYVVAQPDTSALMDSIGFNVWRIDTTTGTSWRSSLDKKTPYRLVGVSNGRGEPVVQLLTAAQVQVLDRLAARQTQRGLLTYYRLKPSDSLAYAGPLKTFAINGRTQLALFGFANGQVYRWKLGEKQLKSLNVPTGESVQRIVFSSDGQATARVRKNEKIDKKSAGTLQLATPYLIEQYNQNSKEPTAIKNLIKNLPYHRLDGMSISPDSSHLQYLLGPSLSDNPNAVIYLRPDTTRPITLLGHRVPVLVTAFSPDGQLLLTADTTGILRVYSTRLDRQHLPLAPLLPVEKLALGMNLSDYEVKEVLFGESDWNHLTQTIFSAEEYRHRDNNLDSNFTRMLTQIGDKNLLRRQHPAAVYQFWLRLLPNLDGESSIEIASGYKKLSVALESYLSGLSESQIKTLIKLPETNRYYQQASGHLYIWSRWVNRYPSLITDTLLNRVSQMVQKDIKTLTKEDSTTIGIITKTALQALKPSPQPALFYPQLHELFFHLREKTGNKTLFRASVDTLAERLCRLDSADFNKIAGLDQLLTTADKSSYWWTILAHEYQRRRITEHDYRILIQGSLAYYLVLDGKYPAAIKAACQGLRIRPGYKDADWIQSNLALALLMNGCTKEAMSIYEKYKNQPYKSYRFPDSKIQFREIFLDDLKRLIKQHERQKIRLPKHQLDQIDAISAMVLKPTSQAIQVDPSDGCGCSRQPSVKLPSNNGEHKLAQIN